MALTITYPEELPVSQRRDELAAAIRDHQVVVVAGETGSGKTTQLPKICLELGRGVDGRIGHTQPRRLAARTVAARIAEELGSELGDLVGYAVRFDDRVAEATRVKLMTDGILLAELQRDRDLRAYDTIIVDEAHERSLTIDVLLGYLRQLLPRRPDLKVVITSATIDPQRFADHFGGAPVIEVSGRTYPVEVRYRPLDPQLDDAPDDGDDADPRVGVEARRREPRDQLTGIVDAVRELRAAGPGDVLVFLSGEREIRDAAEALREAELPDTDILPLYARLPAGEQRLVFAPDGRRRVVLATNVAETSLTVPGIRYVVDTGTARISRYSPRLKVQRLPVEPISRASADQRAGRCGRVAPGICIRLYDRDDYEARPAFTEPEVQRTNLASVILTLTSLGLGDVADFPFLDPPDRRAVADGVRLLEELGALTPAEAGRPPRLTRTGRQLARLPVDPRLGRMVIEGHRTGCLREVLVLASALAVDDPRERPTDRAAEADAAHRRFEGGGSDLLALLRLWEHVHRLRRELSGNQLRKRCRQEHLSYPRLREWQDVHAQLRRAADQLGLHPERGRSIEVDDDGAPVGAHADAVHQAVLAGLLSHIGHRAPEGREYRGARGSRFVLHPGSSLAAHPPAWVMAAELVETSRLFARTAARIRPEWIERVGAHLVKRTHSEPLWDRTRGAAVSLETVSLYGVVLASERLVPYERIDPGAARRLFLRHALVDGDWEAPALTFVDHNEGLLDEVALLEDRLRRTDLVIGPDQLVDRYDELVGDRVASARAFLAWYRRASRHDPDVLCLTRRDVLTPAGREVDEDGFPDWWVQGDVHLALSYEHEPGADTDGVTVHVPVELLPSLSPTGFEWLVPGLRTELVAALLRTTPKDVRRQLAPLADTAEAVAAALAADPTGWPGSASRSDAAIDDAGRRPATGPAAPLRRAVAAAVTVVTGVDVPVTALDPGALPTHLVPTFRVEDHRGEGLAEGPDLAALQRALRGRAAAAVRAALTDIEVAGLTTWDPDRLPDPLPERVARTVRRSGAHPAGVPVVGWPALVDEGETVALRVRPSAAAADEAHWVGVRRLLRFQVPVPARRVLDRLQTDAGLALAANPYDGLGALVQDVVTAALDDLLDEAGGPPRSAAGFDRLVDRVRADLGPRAEAIAGDVARVLVAVDDVDRVLRGGSPAPLAAAHADVAAQRAELVTPGFVAAVGRQRLPDVERYLRAARHRLGAVRRDVGRDRRAMAEVQRLEADYARLVDSGEVAETELEHLGWLLEELRVHLFAQQLGTAVPASPERVARALAAAGDTLAAGDR